MFAVNKDYNSYFKVIKPEVEISTEGHEDAMKMAAILMNQGYVVTMYKDDSEADIYCIYATYIGDNGYEWGRMAAFIDTESEVPEGAFSGADVFPTEDVFPDDAEPLVGDDVADDDSDNDPEGWVEDEDDEEAEEDDAAVYDFADDEDEDDEEAEDDVDYYGWGYSNGEFAHQNGREYDDGFYDEDYCMDDYDTYARDCQAYARGYADGWNDADVGDEPEVEAENHDAAVDDEDYNGWTTDPYNRWSGKMPK